MSEVMDDAVMMMPLDLVMGCDLSQMQFYHRAQSIWQELKALRASQQSAIESADTHDDFLIWSFSGLIDKNGNPVTPKIGTKFYTK